MFAHEDHTLPGTIPIPNGGVICELATEAEAVNGKPWLWKMMSSGDPGTREFFIESPDEADRLAWYEAINTLISSKHFPR